jgi:phosphatidylserine/phosphatidylglycerophosphate/cardiolipin synthase-like enzyme
MNLKSYIFTLFFVLSLFSTMAQTITPITDVRALAIGATVTIRGVITCGPELGQARYIQDATGGLGLFFTTPAQAANVLRGDSVTITGTVALFNNLLQLSPITTITVHLRNRPLPEPIIFTGAAINQAFVEANEGKLVRLNEVQSIRTASNAVFPTFGPNSTNYNLNQSTQTQLRTNAASTGPNGVVGKPPPTAGFNVVGILSQFCPTPATGCMTGYQILVRNYDDFILGEGPNIISAVTQTSFNQTSMTLAFETQRPGSTRVEYGLTTNLGTILNDINQVTDHSITLPNLVPGSIYFVKVTSSNLFGTSESTVLPFGTESNSSGRITTYFTGTVANNYGAAGITATRLNQLADDTLIAYINRATESLDIAIYNWNNTSLSNITEAVNAARARGVKVRIVADGGNANVGLQTLDTAVKVQRSPEGNSPSGSFYGIMHNKFMVIDANATNPNLPIVWTGSTNWTAGNINTDYNNVVIFQDQTLAKAYVMEFEEMWGSNTATPGPIFNGSTGVARFGNTKADNTPHEFKVGGKRVQSFFSPTDAVNAKIITAINSADSAFYSANLVITRNDLAFALRDKFTALGAGNCSFSMVNDTGAAESRVVYSIMRQSMGDRNLVETSGGPTLHHKYLIIDPHYEQLNPLVLTGSHNWSNAGEQRNDENTLIIYDYEIANHFYKEYAARLLELDQTPCFLITDISQTVTSNSWSVYPNPNRGSLFVNSSTNAKVSVVDAMGRVLLSSQVQAGEKWLDLSKMSKGNYLIRWQTDQHVEVKKLTIE